jgi:predicted XRE-type DNA-binding protein
MKTMRKLGKRLIASAKQARAIAREKAHCATDRVRIPTRVDIGRRAMKKQRFESVWDAIEPSRAQAANMKARAEMMIAIREAVAGWKLTQVATAKRLGLTQPRLNDLLRGRINKFSLDALINLATAAGLAVRVEVTKAA